MYLAIDIGGTKTLFAVFDEKGQIVTEHKIATPKVYEDFLEAINDVLKNELGEFKFSDCCCAAPGLIEHESGVVKGFGNLDWVNVPLKTDLEKMLPGVPVEIQNDVKLAGLSEANLVHEKYNKVLYMTISTGISVGYIVNGKIDPSLMDAEPGQMMVEHNGKMEKWEDFASGRAIKARYGRIAADIDEPEIWQDYAKDLAPGIAQVLSLIRPEIVIVGGGVGAHFEKFSEPLNQELKKFETSLIHIPPVIKAERPEEAVIYGCYDLIKQT